MAKEEGLVRCWNYLWVGQNELVVKVVEDADWAASMHCVKVWGPRDNPNGRTLYWYATPLNANLKNRPWWGATWCESMPLSDPVTWTSPLGIFARGSASMWSLFLTGPWEEEHGRARGAESHSEKKAIRERREARLKLSQWEQSVPLSTVSAWGFPKRDRHQCAGKSCTSYNVGVAFETTSQ